MGKLNYRKDVKSTEGHLAVSQWTRDGVLVTWQAQLVSSLPSIYQPQTTISTLLGLKAIS